MTKLCTKLKENLKVNTKFKVLMLLVSFTLIALDLISKFYFDDVLKTGSITVINGYFNFALAYNTGVSFSMFNDVANGQYLLAGTAIIVGLFIYCLVFTTVNKLESTCYALIAAGAFGNGVDRIINGHVIDFLDFYYKQWHYPTFNLADCFIFIGVAILLLEGLFVKKAKTK
jgi:signal peptidase II